MKKIFITISMIFIFSIGIFGQDVMYFGNISLNTNYGEFLNQDLEDLYKDDFASFYPYHDWMFALTNTNSVSVMFNWLGIYSDFDITYALYDLNQNYTMNLKQFYFTFFISDNFSISIGKKYINIGNSNYLSSANPFYSPELSMNPTNTNAFNSLVFSGMIGSKVSYELGGFIPNKKLDYVKMDPATTLVPTFKNLKSRDIGGFFKSYLYLGNIDLSVNMVYKDKGFIPSINTSFLISDILIYGEFAYYYNMQQVIPDLSEYFLVIRSDDIKATIGIQTMFYLGDSISINIVSEYQYDGLGLDKTNREDLFTNFDNFLSSGNPISSYYIVDYVSSKNLSKHNIFNQFLLTVDTNLEIGNLLIYNFDSKSFIYVCNVALFFMNIHSIEISYMIAEDSLNKYTVNGYKKICSIKYSLIF